MTAFLYWHAICKMRLAQFEQAILLFDYLWQRLSHQQAGIALAYCYLRTHDPVKAQAILTQIPPLSGRAYAIVNRLERRIQKELANEST